MPEASFRRSHEADVIRPSTPSVILAAPALEDRRRVYDWMVTPGVIEHMMGPPRFPDVPVPSFAEFTEDWVEHYWTHAAPESGRLFLIVHADEQVGIVAHNDVVTTAGGERASELDMWLRGPGETGRGLGPAAIEALVARLARELRVEAAFLQPSARNPRAIRAYAKAGFAPAGLDAAEAAAHFRTEPDYGDSVFLVRHLHGT